MQTNHETDVAHEEWKKWNQIGSPYEPEFSFINIDMTMQTKTKSQFTAPDPSEQDLIDKSTSGDVFVVYNGHVVMMDSNDQLYKQQDDLVTFNDLHNQVEGVTEESVADRRTKLADALANDFVLHRLK